MNVTELLTRHGITLASPAPGRHYTTCPKCSAERGRHNQSKKVLGVTIDDKGTRWGCSHCGWTGPEKGSGDGNGRADDNLTTYDYQDAAGAVVFQKVRAYDKNGKKYFWLRRPDGRGGWIKNTEGVDTKLLYRLPEILEAIELDREIAVVEGEKDADNLWRIGIPATCNAHGASDVGKAPKWLPQHSAQLRDASIIVLNDNDAAGYAHADAVVRSSLGIAKRVRRLDLAKHWQTMSAGGDVSDWLAAGHSREQLDALIEAAPEWNGDGADEPATLPLLDVTAWEGVPVPPRDWAVKDRIPRRNVTLLSGEGGVGKSVIILQLCVAHVLGGDWLAALPEPGPVLYLNAEDDDRELHFRMAAIVGHVGTSFAALGDLHILPLAGKDALLGTPDRAGIIRPTPLFEQLHQIAVEKKPALIALDTAADMFGGNENDRGQVRQFIGLLRGLAITANAGVLLASHPSLTGINTDSGLSGSTGWHNSVRSRLFFKAADASDGESNPDLRELVCRKNNYGPSGEVVRVRWQNGVFVPVSTPSSLERMAAERAVENLFLDLLDRHNRQGQPVSPHATSPSNYAPKVFAKHRDGKGTGKTAFADAMQRLIEAGTIRIEVSGSPSKQRSRLVRT